MTNNAFLDEIERRYDLEDLSPDVLAHLAIAQEIHEMNRLTVAMNTPTRVVSNVQAPISPRDLHSQKVMALPEEEGDER